MKNIQRSPNIRYQREPYKKSKKTFYKHVNYEVKCDVIYELRNKYCMIYACVQTHFPTFSSEILNKIFA